MPVGERITTSRSQQHISASCFLIPHEGRPTSAVGSPGLATVTTMVQCCGPLRTRSAEETSAGVGGLRKIIHIDMDAFYASVEPPAFACTLRCGHSLCRKEIVHEVCLRDDPEPLLNA